MCNRLTRDESEVDEFSERHRLTGDDIARLLPTWNASPGTDQPVVAMDSAGRVRIIPMRWGLRSRSGDGPVPTNARAETLAQRPMFRPLLARRRCVIPASGWYEWRREAVGRRPYFLTATDRSLVGFAGLYDAWRDEDGMLEATYCIITVPAAPAIADVHDRMPAILRAADETVWLDGRAADARRVLPLLRSYPDDLLMAHPVGPGVNDPRRDAPDLIRPVRQTEDDGEKPLQVALELAFA